MTSILSAILVYCAMALAIWQFIMTLIEISSDYAGAQAKRPKPHPPPAEAHEHEAKDAKDERTT